MSNRLEHWGAIERAAKDLLTAMERAACDPSWTDSDIERLDGLHDAVSHRPRLSVAELGAMRREAASMKGVRDD